VCHACINPTRARVRFFFSLLHNQESLPHPHLYKGTLRRVTHSRFHVPNHPLTYFVALNYSREESGVMPIRTSECRVAKRSPTLSITPGAKFKRNGSQTPTKSVFKGLSCVPSSRLPNLQIIEQWDAEHDRDVVTEKGGYVRLYRFEVLHSCMPARVGPMGHFPSKNPRCWPMVHCQRSGLASVTRC